MQKMQHRNRAIIYHNALQTSATISSKLMRTMLKLGFPIVYVGWLAEGANTKVVPFAYPNHFLQSCLKQMVK